MFMCICVYNYCSDMSKPINVLTGIDYWLDNLMCNVPELAMCYHDNGIVQVGLQCCIISSVYYHEIYEEDLLTCLIYNII